MVSPELQVQAQAQFGVGNLLVTPTTVDAFTGVPFQRDPNTLNLTA